MTDAPVIWLTYGTAQYRLRVFSAIATTTIRVGMYVSPAARKWGWSRVRPSAFGRGYPAIGIAIDNANRGEIVRFGVSEWCVRLADD